MTCACHDITFNLCITHSKVCCKVCACASVVELQYVLSMYLQHCHATRVIDCIRIWLSLDRFDFNIIYRILELPGPRYPTVSILYTITSQLSIYILWYKLASWQFWVTVQTLCSSLNCRPFGYIVDPTAGFYRRTVYVVQTLSIVNLFEVLAPIHVVETRSNGLKILKIAEIVQIKI